MLDLSRLRRDFRLSQADFGKALDVSTRTVGNWERGDHSIDLATIFKIARVLNIEVLEIFKRYLIIEGTKSIDRENEVGNSNILLNVSSRLGKMEEKINFVYEYLSEKSSSESIEILAKNIKENAKESNSKS